MRRLVWVLAAGLGWLLYAEARRVVAVGNGDAGPDELAALSPFAEQA